MDGIYLWITCMIIAVLGYMAGYAHRNVIAKEEQAENEITVRRAKPNLRNPLHPYTIAYDRYKTKEGLYEPQSPKRKGDF